jgi:flagellar operon protein
MNIQRNQFLSIEQLTDTYLQESKRNQQQAAAEGKISFGQILEDKSNSFTQGSVLKFSKHASNRLNMRNIELSDEQVVRLQDGMQKANAKGIKDSLVIVDKLAFIVNVPSNTVVTAMEQSETGDNIFTNIDGAVIV